MLRCLILIIALLTASVASATEAGWALLREGSHVVLLRHAYTSAPGDPVNVQADDCSTQRPLSDRGRQQARKMGALFAARADTTDKILSSRFCRALETASLAFRSPAAEPTELLDPPPEAEAARTSQIRKLRELIAGWHGNGNLVLVTHLANIEGLTGQTAREGEAVIVRAEGDKVHVLARIAF